MGREELMAALEGIMETVAGVSGAAYFGSIARGTEDDLSDIDLIVRCDSMTAWALSRRMDEELGVVLYRPFSSSRAPSGRYWFEPAHPFARLDVSFHRPGDYDGVVSGGAEFVQPPLRRIDVKPRPRPAVPRGGTSADWPIEATDFADALRNYQEAAKAVARGKAPKRPFIEERARVIDFASSDLPDGAWQLFERSEAIIARPE